ncbi:lycopene cyclase family protein [Pseudonocardia sp. KRD-184]|uniref:Lycopene cyclase family protein n=1 Tax=Pseudonocardia oceani TaxID=2792013 RepID=A0ABS6UIR7_9PSEU|nr:lycopene cyclase family protein [Pseudonocardia oceani]MBW0098628.1 lycopene cyclase family protein [Pseudonocardia oceani]MBW0111141.1 lycopene cyclase family protein [Pseudonocardia oceani]MBW0123738.1 lycopene cyclase family protein [Pseudonocardia oceani]MBW0132150.1 lycopene cyclase family protein [Pseudonocardia oceani]
MSASPTGPDGHGRGADDVLVVGGGPAGRALAAECGARGLRTTLLDPAPARPWPATYGAWVDELPDLPAGVVAARAAGRAVALTAHRLDREYAVLDVPALRVHLDDGMDRGGVRVRAGRAVGSPAPGSVALADGTVQRARLVVDAGGRAQPLDPGAPRRVPTEQTAYGVTVDADVAAPVVADGEALFMDWRPDHGEPGWPTFLYAIPLGGGRVLLEETSLARRPGLPLPVLRRRLHARLRRHGVVVPGDAPVEKVSFPLDRPRHRAPHVLGFGAAAPLVHPATGFSLASALALAPAVARAAECDDPLAAARATVWPPAARVVHRVRGVGLEALLRMPAEEVPGFFEVFFGLPERHRRAYLSGRDDLRGTLVTMTALFGSADGRLRRRLVGPALLPRLRDNGEEREAAPIG